MAREFAKSFYKSKAWKTARQAYFQSHRLCERCLADGILQPGEIVHHRIHLTPSNINDPRITLSFDNLETVCRQCHADEHPEIYKADRPKPRVAFDEDGNVVRLGER